MSNTINEELNDTISTDTYYKIKVVAVKWKRNIPSQRGHDLGVNIVDVDSTGPTQLVPQGLQSPLGAFELTLPVNCVETLFPDINQRYNQHC